jgi:2-hydroxychromene-2-carboxylate isomerase
MSVAHAIEFWFDFASTYSYPAAMRIEALAERSGHVVRWRPFLLGAIFQAQGWHDSPFNIYPAKGRYMWRDLERLCASLGIPFRKPARFPRNGLLAARVACAFEEETWLAEFSRRVYTANFAEDLDIAKADVLIDCLNGLVDDPVSILAAARGAEAKARLRANTERAGELGIFGAPTFIAGDEVFWGNDRLEAALAWRVAGQD